MNEHLQPLRNHVVSEVEPCPTCRRTQQTIHRFLESGDYWQLAEAFDLLRADDPKGTQHLDRWQADAALIARQWDAAWEFRTLGLLESNRRITFEDVINVRAQCRVRSLSAADLHLVVLSDNALTPWGNEHLEQVNAAVYRVLADIHLDANTNPLQALYDRYASRSPTDDDLAVIAGECDHFVSARLLKRHLEGETYTIDQYRQRAATGIDSARVDQQLYEWHTSPKKWCFQPTQGRFVEALAVGFNADGSVRRRDHPRFSYTRPPGWMRVAAQALCQALLRRSENDVRKEAGLPEIGEGWVSETELYRLIVDAFPDTPVLQHARPQWLKSQHFDVYLPAHNVALEYQGRQHFEAIDFFGGEEALRRRREQDARKRRLCRKIGCILIEVEAGYEPSEVIEQVRAATETIRP